ncbi:hypothetical protein ACFST9_09990 [Hymenobacter monticola]|uniref:Phosphopeptide-binding protein n=1 Tax=Hymenobacter monticola TaxID=1705399 RepID=A0ABY4B9A5_9BACT|nr:hypothetical protein [Hymenobacter monticola]UOE35469.1 hypothetical protein MTP16_07415 [Hymenobacter monticola]
MKTSHWLLCSTLTLAALAGCETSKPATDVSASAGTAGTPNRTSTSGESMESNGIRLTPFNDSPKFPEAQMQLRQPIGNSTVPSGEVSFNYQITNFQLTKMSGGPHMGEMANSMKGQHIHNIVDNEPYTAHYETTFTKAIPDGQHVVLSFLSRSYHESLKHRGAYDLRVINVGNGTPPATPIINVNGPNLFYSRPKDTYSGADAKRIMLDFYLVNTTLEAGGNRVRATINGTEFMLDRWMPYMMEGLPAGENTVKLELVDSSGTLIPGPYNSVTRKFTVAP